MPSETTPRYTAREELANCLTHGCGVVLSLCGALALLLTARASPHPQALVSCAIYALTLILLYVASTLYHNRAWPDAKALLQTLDHIAIFLLIAGTYTPFVLITLHGAWGWSLFGVTWTLALLGVIFELTSLRRFRRVQIGLYIAMGWIGLVAIGPLVATLPTPGLWLVFGGGAVYTLGVVFYRMRGLRYHHALWHLFVLGGSVLQYFAVLRYVLPGAAR